jgi:endonuclease/exonuclease/phosphatase family metal-dependent hydrolase
MKLRTVTYNVHKCRGMDGRVNTKRIAEVLSEVDADIVALQEVMDHQAEVISSEMKMHFAIGENRKHRGYGYGNVVLSRLPISGSRNYDLSIRGREERGCLRTDLELRGTGALHVFNVHLGTAFTERRHQGRKLIAPELLTDAELQHPRIVLGDFNEWTRGLATHLLCAHMKSAEFKSRSYPGFLPLLHLDHIYYDEALQLEKLALHRTRRSLIASDHLPLVGDFVVTGKAKAAHADLNGAQKEKGSK